MKRIFAVLSLASVVACSAAPGEEGDDGTTASQDELISQQTFNEVSRIVGNIKYLPFEYKVDGCYARSLYMAMELAATGHESNAIFAFAKPGLALQVGNVRWVYHVAPMLFVGQTYQTSRWLVIDPSMSTTALDARTWIARMGYPEGTPNAVLPSYSVVPGSAYGPNDPSANATNKAGTGSAVSDVQSFAAMPAFDVHEVQESCNVMHKYLGKEASSNVAAKKLALVVRTGELLANLRGRRKINEDAIFSAAQCAASN
jgi:hypothetical protein